ncbi:UmuC protein [Streptomyces sp. NBRC 110611]|nr:UmuC protein [Streptomyces sp. NBRC 110611]
MPVEASREFDEYLCTLPWIPSRLDWREIPYSVFSYEDAGWSGDLAVEWARTHHFMDSEHAFIMYSATEPGILCSSRDAFFELDYLTMGRVHPAYICAASAGNDGPVLSFNRFAEWDGFAVLTTPSP